MHDRTLSGDSLLVLQRNPLNMRYDDGTDLVLDEDALRQTVSVNKPRLDMSPQRSHGEVAEIIDERPLAKKLQPAPTSVSPLIVAKRAPSNADLGAVPELNLKAKPSISDLGISAPPQLDLNTELGTSFVADFGDFGLSRKNTIASRSGGAVKSGPSRSPDLIQRLRSVRKQLSKEGVTPTPNSDLGMHDLETELPASLLKVIAFSPNAQWLESDSEDDEDLEVEAKAEPETTNKQLDTDVEKKDESDEVLTAPLDASSEEIFKEASASPCVEETVTIDHLPAELMSTISEGTPAENEATSTRDSMVYQSPATFSSTVEEVSTPCLSASDPVSAEDRGRLFLQINKLAGLRTLPIDATRNPRFTLTLDNGLQTVTTPPVSLSSPQFSGVISAKIGQEFELLVGQDLELVVTINVLMDAVQPPVRSQRPQQAEVIAASPPPSPRKGMRGLLSSKKTKAKAEKVAMVSHETYLRDEREHDLAMEAYRRKCNLWKGITGPAGELARGYLFESHYESEIYGQARTYSLPFYNEWANENDPRHTCDLQVTLMFVPRLYNSEELPTSLTACQRELRIAQDNRSLAYEGYLTQNGGDCSLWRRRWFTLKRNELVGHHEATRKVRTLIHMENANEIIDCAEAPPSEDLWCIYEDRTFQVTFRDGEELSFYADTIALKQEWLRVLRLSTAYCSGQQRRWTDLVLDREEEEESSQQS